MYARIVVPLDGSDLAEQALAPAEEMARLTGAPLHLVRVVDLASLGHVALTMPAPPVPSTSADEKTAAQEYLEEVRRPLVERKVPVMVEVRRGLVPQELLALTRPTDLIVIASHGRSGLARWFLGSVAEEVMRRASVPVLLVHATVGTAHPNRRQSMVARP